MAILYVGIDLAKNVFAVHGVDAARQGQCWSARACRAPSCIELIAALPPCTDRHGGVLRRAPLGAAVSRHGHTVRLMAPKFVAPYRMSGKRGKNDAADAAAICEAVQRPNMRFVPVKSQDEQARLCVHRVRQGLVEQRTATINRIRGLLSEFGIVLPLKAATVRREAAAHLEDLPGWANTAIGDSLSELHRLDERIAEYDRHVDADGTRGRSQPSADAAAAASAARPPARWSPRSATRATSRTAANSRPGSAWCPGSTARAARPGWAASPRPATATCERCSCWAPRRCWPPPRPRTTGSAAGPMALEVRRGYWKAVVAIAAKNARMAWAVLAKGENFKPLEA